MVSSQLGDKFLTEPNCSPLVSHTDDRPAESGISLFDGSFVQNTKQKSNSTKAQIARRYAVMLEGAGKSTILQLLSDSDLIIESVIRRKDFILRTAGTEVAHVELVKPLWSHTRRQHRVPVAARRLKQQQPTWFQHTGNLPM